MKKSDSIVEISKALVGFRKDLKQPPKDAKNPFYKSAYSTLDKVIEAIDNASTEYGLSFTQTAVNNEQGNVGVETLLLHTSGEYIHYDALFMKPEKPTPQAIGSAITYSRRYSISAIFGITSDEDDDGNQATGNGNNNKKQANKLPVQDKGKVMLVKQKATDLSEIINSQEGADTKNPTTQQQILNAYLKKVGATDISKTTNEQLVNMLKFIEQNIGKYQDK